MALNSFLLLIVFLFPLAYSPGPGNIFFALNSARFGYKSTLMANFGYHLATWIVTFIIGLIYLNGLSKIPSFLMPLKYLGSLYIMYLAFKLFRASAVDSEQEAKSARFIDGVLLLLFNPKAYVIILLLFTQFLTVSDSGKYIYLILITTIFTLNNLIAFLIWALLGDVLLKRLRDEKHARLLNKIFAIILFLVGIWIVLS